MDRCVNIIIYKLLVDKYGILVVVAFPCHEADKCVLTQRDLALRCSGTVRKHLTFLDLFAFFNDRTLVYAGTLVGALELDELVLSFLSVLILYTDLIGCNSRYNTVFLGKNAYAGIDSGLVFHTCADYRILCDHKRNCLSLHVRAH